MARKNHRLGAPHAIPRARGLSAHVLIAAIVAASGISAAQAADYEFRHPLSGVAAPASTTPEAPLAFSLSPAVLPEAIVGAPYTAYDFKPLLTMTGDNPPAINAISWSAPLTLPAGMLLGADGLLSGTPTAANAEGAPFQVQASYETTNTQQGYALRVIDPVVTLSAAELPAGMVGQPYAFDFKTKLDVAGDPNYSADYASFEAQGALPAGLSLDSYGQVSGTPTTKNTAGTSFKVVASYKTREGEQTYTIVVNGVALQVTQLAAGANHTCAVTTAGAVKCWGKNNSGQLGNGTTANSNVPVAVSGLSGAAQLEAGGDTTCAITSGGAAVCWGANTYGQLGNGGTAASSVPIAVSGLSSGVAQIAAGGEHNCARTSAGAVVCWGRNHAGQLGDGTTTNRLLPVAVTGLGSGASNLDVGLAHTCAVKAGGVQCWGAGDFGQRGMGLNYDSPVPESVPSLSGVARVVAGSYHTCALTNGGAVLCWGSNSLGTVGDGTWVNRESPVGVTGLGSGVTQLVAGNYFNCAVTSAGAAVCWGNNGTGQLGYGVATGKQAVPVSVTGLSSGVGGLIAGGQHACARVGSNVAKCWGLNTSGQVGDGTVANKSTPVDVMP